MPRIRGVGELDWWFTRPYTDHEEIEKLILTCAHRTPKPMIGVEPQCHLLLKLVLDEEHRGGYHEEAAGFVNGTFSDASTEEGEGVGERDLRLPSRLREALRALSTTQSVLHVNYCWMEPEFLRILIVYEKEVKYPTRFITSLARKFEEMTHSARSV